MVSPIRKCAAALVTVFVGVVTLLRTRERVDHHHVHPGKVRDQAREPQRATVGPLGAVSGIALARSIAVRKLAAL
jgi:hypothetical protein